MASSSAMASPADCVIEAPRLVLRPLVYADAEALANLLNDPRVTDGMPSAARDCDASRARRLIAAAARARELRQELHWAVERRDSPILLGELSLDLRRGEIGLWLGCAHWRQGYGTEALAALLPRTRTEHGLHQVRASIVRGNVASTKLFERHGFVFAGLRIEAMGTRRIVWMDYLRRAQAESA
jgi:[ribosomal protein S5]-alanine N-acetyltransferase